MDRRDHATELLARSHHRILRAPPPARPLLGTDIVAAIEP
jgi:hypothetical protein